MTMTILYIIGLIICSTYNLPTSVFILCCVGIVYSVSKVTIKTACKFMKVSKDDEH